MAEQTSEPQAVSVTVRVRPLMAHELHRGDKMRVAVQPNEVGLRVFTKGHAGSLYGRDFSFDRCLGPETQQDQFFGRCGVTSLLEAVIDGYSGTICAYGQTGSGKTYTMSGVEEQMDPTSLEGGNTPELDGLIPRAIGYLYQRLSELQAKVALRASFLEVYNERVYDLLNPGNAALPLRWSSNSYFVQDLVVVDCGSADDVMEVLAEGHRNRRVASHDLNKDSSRSHSLMTISLEIHRDTPDGPVVSESKVVFVDLAGSERLKESHSSGETQKETGQINRSLFVLGQVASLLSKGDAANASPRSKGDAIVPRHIPYRDSTLTKLLMDSLGGESMALIICCISPSQVYVDETLNTLNFGSRARNMRNKPTKHIDPQQELIRSLRAEIRALRDENAQLRTALEAYTQGSDLHPPPLQAPAPGGPVRAAEIAPTPIAAASHAPHYDASQLSPPTPKTEEPPLRAPPSSSSRSRGEAVSRSGYAARHHRGQRSSRRESKPKPPASRSHRSHKQNEEHKTPPAPPKPSPPTARSSQGEGVIRPGPAARMLFSARSEASEAPDTPPYQSYPYGPGHSDDQGTGHTHPPTREHHPVRDPRDQEAAWILAEERRRRMVLEEEMEQYRQLPSLMHGYEQQVQELRGALEDAHRSTTTFKNQCRATLQENNRLNSQLEHLEDFMNDSSDPIQPYHGD